MAALKDALVRVYPLEGCGILIGLEGPDGSLRVLRATATRNTETTRGADRYSIDPRDYLAIEEDLKRLADGSRVIGFFHSHPDAPARPSRVDLESAQGLFDVTRTFYVYAIAEVRLGRVADVTVWRLAGDLSGFEKLKCDD